MNFYLTHRELSGKLYKRLERKCRSRITVILCELSIVPDPKGHNGALRKVKWGYDTTNDTKQERAPEQVPQTIENMVELVGIEPTTSSLRTKQSPIFSQCPQWLSGQFCHNCHTNRLAGCLKPLSDAVSRFYQLSHGPARMRLHSESLKRC